MELHRIGKLLDIKYIVMECARRQEPMIVKAESSYAEHTFTRAANCS